MGSASSKRPPYPDDMKIGPTGVMLVDGTIVAKKTQSMENVAPTVQEYDSAPIYKERTFAFQPLRGMGERIQSSATSQRYYYGLNIWVIGGLIGKGPLTHTLTPPTTGSIRDFVDALDGGTLKQFILAGANVLKRNGDTNGTQVVSETRAATAMSAVRFEGQYASPIDALYVGWSDGAIRQYDGASWNSASLPAGFAPQFLEKVGNQLWAADPTTNTIRNVSGDPMLAANWSGSITFNVGDPTAKITAIRGVDNQLVVFRSDGAVFTLNGDGSANDLFPGLRVSPNLTNGATAQAWLDSVWFRMGTSFYQLSMSGPTLTPVGPERLRNNASEVQGPVQAFAGYGAIGAFMAVYNGTNSYLLQYGNWLPPFETTFTRLGTSDYEFVDQFDGAVVKWASKKVTAMRVSGIASPDDRLYVGFSDGTYDYIKLVPNPLAPNSGAEFTLGASQMFIPVHHAMFQADWKTINGFSIFGPTLTNADFAEISYRTDGGVSITTDRTIGTLAGRLIGSLRAVPIGHLHGGTTNLFTDLDGTFTTPGMRLDTPAATVAHAVEVQVNLVNSTTADTPVIDTVAIHESVRPSLKLDYAGAINAQSRAARRDGSTSRLTAEQVRDVAFQAASSPSSVTITLPDEETGPLSFFGYQETLLERGQRNGLGWRIDFQATEFKTKTVFGTVGRFKGVSIGDLSGTRIGQLKSW